MGEFVAGFLSLQPLSLFLFYASDWRGPGALHVWNGLVGRRVA